MSSTIDRPYAARKDALRVSNETFQDLERLVVMTYELYRKIHKVATPYNNKQQDSSVYIPPSRELFTSNIRTSNNLLEASQFAKMVSSTIDFYTKHKGKRQLVEPHPSLHHSVQFNSKQFKLTEVENTKALAAVLNKTFNYAVKTLTRLEILDHGDIKPIYFDNLPADKFEYLILRPKMGKTGVPVVKYWEALFYKQSHQYLIDHVDSNINPRYCGMI
jgi:hypothetical protein